MLVDDIYNQRCVEPGDIYELLPLLYKYASKCSHVTEFGVRSLVSTYALLAARPHTVISYDHIHPDATGGNLQQAIDAATEAGVTFIFRQEDTLRITIEPTDMLFIDTLHTYDQLKQELALHADKVRKYLVFHDTSIDSWGMGGELNSFGLWFAIKEFLRDNPNWDVLEKVEYCAGLTVLVKDEFTK